MDADLSSGLGRILNRGDTFEGKEGIVDTFRIIFFFLVGSDIKFRFDSFSFRQMFLAWLKFLIFSRTW